MLKKLLPTALLFCACALQPALAAEDTIAADIIALEIRNLSTSVDRLTQLLYSQGPQKEQDAILRKLDIAVAYLNFRSRRIEMLERDQQNAQSMKSRLEDVIHQVENRIEQLEDASRNDSAISAANEQPRNEALEQLKMLQQRLARTDDKVLTYDNRILELRNQLDDVEGFVERHLEL